MESDRSQPTDHLGRDAKDFAIEFGGYLADAVEGFLEACWQGKETIDPEIHRALQSAAYEFRKRVSHV